MIIERTKSEGLTMAPLSCHCEADEVSRSNLVEGPGIATHLSGARNDKKRGACNDSREGRVTQSEDPR